VRVEEAIAAVVLVPVPAQNDKIAAVAIKGAFAPAVHRVRQDLSELATQGVAAGRVGVGKRFNFRGESLRLAAGKVLADGTQALLCAELFLKQRHLALQRALARGQALVRKVALLPQPKKRRVRSPSVEGML
jgi:hypothetical protein